MTTKNFSKSFKGKINGQRLPPIAITNEPSAEAKEDPPTSILKKPKTSTDNVPNHDRTLPLDDGMIL